MYSLNRNRFETEFRETDTVHSGSTLQIKLEFKESMVSALQNTIYKHTTPHLDLYLELK